MSTNFSMLQNVLERSLDSQSLRFKVLSNNIANASTPNFKRSDVTFYETLNKALKSQQSPYPFEAVKTDKKHIPFFEKVNYKSVKPKIFTEYYSSTQNNGNNVDVEFEMAESAKTTLLYNATSSMLTRNYNKINMLLK